MADRLHLQQPERADRGRGGRDGRARAAVAMAPPGLVEVEVPQLPALEAVEFVLVPSRGVDQKIVEALWREVEARMGGRRCEAPRDYRPSRATTWPKLRREARRGQSSR